MGVGDEGFVFVFGDDGEPGLRNAMDQYGLTGDDEWDVRMRRGGGNDCVARRAGPVGGIVSVYRSQQIPAWTYAVSRRKRTGKLCGCSLHTIDQYER